ncbi:glycosyltransferase [Streptomyces daliensis]
MSPEPPPSRPPRALRARTRGARTRGARRPRVLYLAFYFPPSRASGVYRARATANHLAARGWDVTVCAAPLSFLHEVTGSVDEALLDTVSPGVRMERPSLNQFVWDKDLRRYGPFRRTFPVAAQDLYDWGMRRLFPEHYASWALAAVRRALRLHATRGRFDAVLATGNPFASFAAAWAFHRLTGVPYVLDYRDSWTLNLFTEEPAFPAGHPAWEWERRVLGAAGASVFVNEALRGWHAERYPDVADRMMVVPNGWDADLLSAEARALPAPPSGARRRPLRFSYVGTVSSAQPVEEMVAGFQRLRAHPDFADAELHIHGHLGFFRQSHTPLLGRLAGDGDGDKNGTERGGSRDTGVRVRGPLSKTEISRAYEEADVLVFLAGGARYVTSGKIFEYMATGRPIASVHLPGIAAGEVLEGYPLWFASEGLDAESVSRSLLAAGRAALAPSRARHAHALRHSDAYVRDTLLAPLEARLRSLAGRRTPSADGSGASTGTPHADGPPGSVAAHRPPHTEETPA